MPALWRHARFCGLRGSGTAGGRRGASGSVFQAHEQDGQCHVQRRRHLGDVLEAQIALAALDRAHEGPVDAAVIGEGLLRIALLGP